MAKHHQTGLRARFRRLLDPGRAAWPRSERKLSSDRVKSTLNHPISWYVDGHLVERPMNGAYALAVFAEWCLAKARAKKGNDLRAATDFYADTRRFLEMIVCNRRAGRPVRGGRLERMKPRVAELVAKARLASEGIRR